ncbi:MAG TPA: TATA-box-binding protein, partial [Methanocorpusculum sp.]|nr:TATA-box-binding protein [Methanocorpusculum sp.]
MSTFPAESLKIENVVASTKLSDSLDLVSLAAQIPGAEYNK